MPAARQGQGNVVGNALDDSDDDSVLDGDTRDHTSLESAQAAEHRVTEVVEKVPGGSSVLQAIRSLPFDLGKRPVPILAGLLGLLLLISVALLFGRGSGAAGAPAAAAAVPDSDAALLDEEPMAEEEPAETALEEVQEPGLCSPGQYIGGSGQCEHCLHGAVRRRRAKSCTPCPAGQFDFGEHDDCFEVSYWASYDGVDCEGSTLPGEHFSTILDAKHRCIELGQGCIAIQDAACDGSSKLSLCDGHLITSTEDLSPSEGGSACTRVKETTQACQKFTTQFECKLPRCYWQGECIEVFQMGFLNPRGGGLGCLRGANPVRDEMACKMAAVTLGKRWVGGITKASKPRGCYVERGVTVGYNKYAGAPGSGKQLGDETLPICFSARKCPLDWVTTKKGVCYRVYSDMVTWRMAESECVRAGGHLASVQSPLEAKDISGMLNGDWAWVGHNLTGGSMAWSDGTQTNFIMSVKDWASGGFSKSGDCGVLGPDGRLGDNTCDAKLRFVCSVKATGIQRGRGNRRLLGPEEPRGFSTNVAKDDEELARRLSRLAATYRGRMRDDDDLSLR